MSNGKSLRAWANAIAVGNNVGNHVGNNVGNRIVRWVLFLMSSLCVLGGLRPEVFAQEDPNQDPLAFFRIDTDARDQTVTVVYRTEGSTRRTSGRMLLVGSEEMYLRSAAVAAIFKATRIWEVQLRKLTFRVRDHSFQLTAGSRLVIHNEGETLLPTPILTIDGDLWLPVEFLTRLLGPITRESVAWDIAQHTLHVGSTSYNITRLRVESLTRATAVHIRCSEPLSYRTDSSEPGYIILKVYKGNVDPAAVSRSGQRGLVESVESRQYEDFAKIYVQVNDLVSRYRTYTRDEGREIVLVLEEEEITALPEPTPRGKLRVKVQDGPVDVTHPIDVRTVVIDPGHGGVEVGRVGPNGALEKDVNLAVAKELKRILTRNSDIEVVLTREKDELLGLSERAEKANKAHGDLFISLHCNGWFNQGASGVETYFLSPAESDWSKSVAATENQGLEDSELVPEDVTFIVWELVQNKFISSSSDLAEIVQAQLVQRAGASDRGVRQAGFRVLVGAYMPAVLVEMGFLSNPNEERKLRDRSYQRDLATAMSEAILMFKERYAQTAQTMPTEEEEW